VVAGSPENSRPDSRPSGCGCGLFRQRIQGFFSKVDKVSALHPSPLTQTAHLYRTACVVFLNVVTFIFRNVSIIFLVGLFPKKDMDFSPSDPKRLRRGILGVFCSCPTWHSAPVRQEQQVVPLRALPESNWLRTNRLLHPAGEATMAPRTLFLSRLIGLYCILVALSMITRRQATVESVTALLQNPSMIFVLGAITLVAGLAMVLAHNIWSGGPLTVIVTLVGWMTLIKSASFLFLSPEVKAEFFLRQLHYQQLFYLYGFFLLVLGVYLTYGGFKARSA
jgi:hypothetical protein